MEEKQIKINDYKQRFIRWQQLTHNQLSISNNLILTLTLGFLAFSVSNIGLKLQTNGFLVLSIVICYLFLITSLICGVLLTINRLYDFRKTKDLIKTKRKRFELDDEINNLDKLKSINKNIDNLKNEIIIHEHNTWKLIHWQLWTFIVGSIIGIILLVIRNN